MNTRVPGQLRWEASAPLEVTYTHSGVAAVVLSSEPVARAMIDTGSSEESARLFMHTTLMRSTRDANRREGSGMECRIVVVGQGLAKSVSVLAQSRIDYANDGRSAVSTDPIIAAPVIS
jgi:hypothetical protein